MIKFNNCTVEFQFEFSAIAGRHMQVAITVNSNDLYTVTPTDTLVTGTKINIELPSQIVLTFFGKNHNTDTVLDSDGNITQDIFVKILSISIDGFQLNEKFLHQKLKLVTVDNQEIFTAYIGFNGNITIDLSAHTVFSQYLSMNS